MTSRIGITTAILLCAATAVCGQTVRFETTMGNFDMVLNPTSNSALQGYVDNFLHYVNTDRYLGSWINRADTGFVLQMGGFFSHTKRPPLTIDSTRPVAPYFPVAGVPADTLGLSNIIGTVALALPGDGMGGTNHDAGTSSFFVNLADNSFLDPDFTVFAAIPDMTVINQIMALTTIDRTNDSNFGATSGDLGFTNVPIQSDGFQVFIKRAFVITDAMTVAKDRAGIGATMSDSAAAFGAGSSAADFGNTISAADLASGSSAPLLSPNTVPEPSCLLLAAFGSLALWFRSRRRR
ncbi:MAG TPA: peptidylprolyl isomerase [Lacipirellulaceae bacterium]|nr:peptidylprolyl isomerase [Lacipirellulaceae bacterium]